MEKYKILAIIGESATGKDSIAQLLVPQQESLNSISSININRYNFKKIVSYTTRPAREGEVHGKDYYFVDDYTFLHLLTQNKILDHSEFNKWFYGTCINSLDKELINVGVFDPTRVKELLKNENLEVYVARIACSDKERLNRSLNREEYPDCVEICRRFLADKKDFETLDFAYHLYTNENIDIHDLSNILLRDALKFFNVGQSEIIATA